MDLRWSLYDHSLVAVADVAKKLRAVMTSVNFMVQCGYLGKTKRVLEKTVCGD